MTDSNFTYRKSVIEMPTKITDTMKTFICCVKCTVCGTYCTVNREMGSASRNREIEAFKSRHQHDIPGAPR